MKKIKKITNYAVDIYCSNRMKLENDNFQNMLINSLLFKELRDFGKETTYGSVNCRDNFHFKTPNGIILSYFSYGRFSISGAIFTGDPYFNNKPILIRTSAHNYYNTQINIYDIREQNTSGNVSQTNKQMTSGINSSLLFFEDGFNYSGSLPIKYDQTIIEL